MKKPEKKKAGKKKTAEDSAPKSSREALQREFNKKMKTLVRDINKETKATIKNALKEAKLKLKKEAELLMNEVLQALVITGSNPEAAETEQKSAKGKKALAAAPESNAEAPAVEAQTATRLTGPRKTKSLAPVAPKPVVTRRRRATTEQATSEAPASSDQE